MRSLFPPLFALALGPVLLAGCGESSVNPPDQPAAPVQSPEALREIDPPGPASLARRGAPSFVGVWSANALWCANPQGDRRPIILTPQRFEGYENSCDIARIREVAGGYDADLVCQSEGQTAQETVRLAVSGDMLMLTYLDREGQMTKLGRCPGSPKAEASSSGGLMKMLKKAD